MKDIILLTKVLLKSSKSNTKKTDTNLAAKFFTFLIFLFVYIYLAGIFGYITYQITMSLYAFNAEKIFLNIFFVGLLGFSIFQAIFTSLNVLFFSKDIEGLLPLPIKPYKIIMAKFNCLVVSQYLIYSVSALPILVVYGYVLKFGALYYLYSLLILLIFPVIPVVFVSLLLTIVMKFTNIIKNKETVQYITVAISILVIIFLQFTLGVGNQEITNEELATELIDLNNSFEKHFSVLINLKSSAMALNNYNNIRRIRKFYFFYFRDNNFLRSN